ncbi:MAG: hypothetical protein U5R31_03325 [Acidimicrobiia bacterium]|nr:hypothetical protein [Acidimicrobiia bacterium]
MIAAGCDIRVADERAEFGLPEARWNLPAQWLGALGRQMLPAHALSRAGAGANAASPPGACTRWAG